MNPLRSSILTICVTMLFLITPFTHQVSATSNRDILWDVVTRCLDPAVANYDKVCRWPLENSAAACRNTTGMWDSNSDFVILRDRKMCDCLDNKGFVHGLAIPRAKVTGAEDPSRPAGIWQYAWDIAATRIGNVAEIALVANPPGTSRSQDQLHVHLVRLNEAGKRLVTMGAQASVARLDMVWEKASQLAAGKLTTYGVLVASNPEGGYVVVVDDKNLEHAYTAYRCP